MSTNILKNVVYVSGAGAAAFGLTTGGAVAQGTDGFYGGVSFGTTVASNIDEALLPSSSDYTFEFGGTSTGLFAGYNMAIGDNWFVGGELSYTHSIDLEENTLFGLDPYGFSDMEDVFDARIRFGTVFDRAAVYTAFGLTWANAPNMKDGLSATSISTSGLNIGVGMEYDVSERFFVSGEIVHRQFGSASSDSPSALFPGGDATTVSIRAGFRF
jgi:outer membrane immunogenic protein